MNVTMDTEDQMEELLRNTSVVLRTLNDSYGNGTSYIVYPMGNSLYPSGFSTLHIAVTSLFVILALVVIVVGNMLVIVAIATEYTLKGLQNWFIASLAVSDLLLGLLIMPFSLAHELMGYWIFGYVWCDVHAALDVLLCTASILNICLISLDRYWSITQAVEYVKKRTQCRTVVMISLVWFLSALISMPALFGWRKVPTHDEFPSCELIDDTGYVIYSALGSFYIPSCIMLFVYVKIYFAVRSRARRKTREQFRNRQRPPSRVYSPKKENPSSGAYLLSVPRPDVGRNKSLSIISADVEISTLRDCSTTETSASGLATSSCYTSNSESNDLKRENSLKASGNLSRRSSYLGVPSSSLIHEDIIHKSIAEVAENESSSSSHNCRVANNNNSHNSLENIFLHRVPTISIPTINIEPHSTSEERGEEPEVPLDNTCDSLTYDIFSNLVLCPTEPLAPQVNVPEDNEVSSNENTCLEPGCCSCSLKRKPSLPAIRRKPAIRPKDSDKERKKILKKREKRATFILGVIMGTFIFCWLPFFLLYVLRPFCQSCVIPDWGFAIAFWLGYINSAVNPIIYTVFNKDFRCAFKKILL